MEEITFDGRTFEVRLANIPGRLAFRTIVLLVYIIHEPALCQEANEAGSLSETRLSPWAKAQDRYALCANLCGGLAQVNDDHQPYPEGQTLPLIYFPVGSNRFLTRFCRFPSWNGSNKLFPPATP